MKVNFLLGAQDPRCYKRAQEFINRGYSVKIYSFDRHTTKNAAKLPTVFIGTFSNSTPYWKRITVYLKAMSTLAKEASGPEDIWYYFGLPTCLFGYFFNRKRRFILEESDMSHLNLKFLLLRRFFESINKYLIKKSCLSVFTSQGFINFHFPDPQKRPNNLVLMPNKLNPLIKSLPNADKKNMDINAIKFGFVGFLRYKAVFNMAEVISRRFPQHQFHFYGIPDSQKYIELFSTLENRDNVFFHGSFKNPDELPKVYSNIDVVVSTYDTNLLNVLYAEPNKLYESIFFRTPIIVSEGTFLASQVRKYNSGYEVNPFEESAICSLVNNIKRSIVQITRKMYDLSQDIAIDSAEDLFEKFEKIVAHG